MGQIQVSNEADHNIRSAYISSSRTTSDRNNATISVTVTPVLAGWALEDDRCRTTRELASELLRVISDAVDDFTTRIAAEIRGRE